MGAFTPPEPTSNLEPQSYNADALGYLINHSAEIDATASVLGVSPDAIAGSVAREITRADGESPASLAMHEGAVILGRVKSESAYDEKFAADKKKLTGNPGAFDGTYGMYHQFKDPNLSDVGPGSIKVLTAIQLITQFGNTKEGIALGLNKYSEHNIKGIVEALEDRNNPLSIHLAGLTILNGVRFFQNKLIDGIPWKNLTQEQQAAALTSYYTVGEHAVATLMAEGKFRPFTPGPTGGQVGQWILYGDNFKKLKAITDSAQFRLNSIAPAGATYVKQPSAKSLPAGQSHAEAEPGPWLRAAELPAVVRASQVLNGEAAVLPNGVFQKGGAAHGVVSRLAASTTNETVRGFLARQSRMQPFFAVGGAAVGGFAPQDSIAKSIRAAMRYVSVSGYGGQLLPSIAPIKQNYQVSAEAMSPFSQRLPIDHSTVREEGTLGLQRADSKLDRAKMREALDEYFMRQARLPPDGSSGFDPRVTPAWPGVKITG